MGFFQNLKNLFKKKEKEIEEVKEEYDVETIEELKEEVILEPSEKELVNTLIPFFIKGDIYAKLLESEVCEQASRANAMEAATDNAKELIDDLKVQFNKARQQSITQEITEIVSAANAI